MKKVIISIMAAVIFAASSCNSTEVVKTTYRTSADGLVRDNIVWVFDGNKVFHRLSTGELVEMPFSATYNGKAVITSNGAFYVDEESYLDNFSFEVVMSH